VAGQRKVIIIAGPNGAGKTTFAREFLPNEAGCPLPAWRNGCGKVDMAFPKW